MMLSDIDYRQLKESDAHAVRELRLSVLKSDPGAFSISVEEESKGSTGLLNELLAGYHQASDRIVLGAFDTDLVGMVGVDRLQGDFTRHKARIWGLYVLQSHRRAGIGAALMSQALGFVNGLEGVEKVMLEVTSKATDAIRLYNNLGFNLVSTETDAIKVGVGYIDAHRMELRLTRCVHQDHSIPKIHSPRIPD